ncbi:MAG: sigma-70 family RNA polymerase sigma factor [Bacteroidia bacterium]
MIAITYMTQSAAHHKTVEQIQEEMELVIAAQKDPRCFEPLYTRYYKTIASFIYHRLDSKEEAFELTSQVFYKALENLSKYKVQGVPFSAWLFRIASNELNLFFRKNKSARFVDIDERGAADLMVSMEDVPSSVADEQLFAALQHLEEEEMELIDMRFFEKRSFKEICDITGLNESACKMKVYRILEKLKKKINKTV